MQAMYGYVMKNVKKSRKAPEHSDTPNRWFTLPREIRDQIYHEVLCRRYLIHRPASWKRGKAVHNERRPVFWFRDGHWHWEGIFGSGHLWMKKRPLFWADIALLLTSKAIYQEATKIMYEGSLFCVYVGKRSERFCRMRPLPSPQLLSRIQNLEIGTSVCDTRDYTASQTWCENFNGTDIKRNTCRISFPCYYCLVDWESHAPFFRACRALVGFKTVTVTLELVHMDAYEEEETLEIYSRLRKEFQAALKPHLGPSRSLDIENVLALEFHPRKHLEDVQAALAKCEAQAPVLEEDTRSGGAGAAT